MEHVREDRTIEVFDDDDVTAVDEVTEEIELKDLATLIFEAWEQIDDQGREDLSRSFAVAEWMRPVMASETLENPSKMKEEVNADPFRTKSTDTGYIYALMATITAGEDAPYINPKERVRFVEKLWMLAGRMRTHSNLPLVKTDLKESPTKVWMDGELIATNPEVINKVLKLHQLRTAQAFLEDMVFLRAYSLEEHVEKSPYYTEDYLAVLDLLVLPEQLATHLLKTLWEVVSRLREQGIDPREFRPVIQRGGYSQIERLKSLLDEGMIFRAEDASYFSIDPDSFIQMSIPELLERSKGAKRHRKIRVRSKAYRLFYR